MSKSLVNSLAIYSLGSILIKSFGFILIPIYTRYLSVEEYGILAILYIILQLVSFVFLLGISTASMRFFFNSGADELYRKELYGTATIILLVLPIMLFAVFSPLVYLLIEKYLPSVPFFPFVFVVLLIGLFNPIQKLCLGMLRVQKKAKEFVVYTFSLFLIQAVLIIIAVTVMGLRLKGIIFPQLIVNFIFWVIALGILKGNSNFTFSKSISKKLVIYGIPLIPYFIFIWIGNASGRFLLERFTSLQDLGIFALAVQFSGLIIILSNAFANGILPYFFETAQRPDSKKILGNFATKYFAFFGLVSLFTLTFAQPLVKIMADPKYHEAVLYIPLLIVASWFRVIYKFFTWSLMYSKRTGTTSALEGISAVFTIVLLFFTLGYWRMGIQGVVIAMVFAGFFCITAGYFISQRFLKIKYQIADILLSLFVILLCGLIIHYNPFSYGFVQNILFRVLFFLGGMFLIIRIAKLGSVRQLLSITNFKNIGMIFKS